METIYKIIFDNGKPYEIIVKGEIELRKELKEFYDLNKDEDFPFNAIVLNESNEDISESQFIEEIIGDIINGEENVFYPKNENGLFITPQEELTESVYNNLLVKPKHKEINKEMSRFIEGLK